MNNESKNISEMYDVDPQLLDENGVIKAFIKYEGLSVKQRRLLSLLSLRASNNLSITDRCKIAGITNQSWYNFMADDKFCKAVKEISPKQIGLKYIPGTIHAIGFKATRGDIPAAKLLFDTVGFTGQSQKSGDQIVNVTVIQAEREDKLGRGLNRFGYVKVDDGSDGD